MSGASVLDLSSRPPLLPVRAMATPRLVTCADWSMIDAPCLPMAVSADCTRLVVATFPLATAAPVSMAAWPLEELESAELLADVFPVALLLPVVAAAVPELVTVGRWSTMLNPPAPCA
jgi:hypothetical protein